MCKIDYKPSALTPFLKITKKQTLLSCSKINELTIRSHEKFIVLKIHAFAVLPYEIYRKLVKYLNVSLDNLIIQEQ